MGDEDNSGKCDFTTPSNILPVSLDTNWKTDNLSSNRLIYDFKEINNVKIKIECPSWMRRGSFDKCTTGAIKITQTRYNDYDTIKFTSIGKLTGTEPGGGICIYYFPESLNNYDDVPHDGGEIVIELMEQANQKKKDKTLLLLFIPVKLSSGSAADKVSFSLGSQQEKDRVSDKLSSKTNNWLDKMVPNTSLKSGEETHEPKLADNTTTTASLNDIIPESAYWIYDDIKIHGECDQIVPNNEYKDVQAIFFEKSIEIKNSSHKNFEKQGLCVNVNDEGVFDSYMGICKDVSKNKLSNNDEDNWINTWLIGKAKSEDESVDVRTENATEGDMNKGSLFYNKHGTTSGPGEHGRADDPFSLTCEPIVDEDDKPIDAKDRLEWVKDIYNNKSVKNMRDNIWILLFVILLSGILIAFYVFIFKNIGLFITQNEIAGRVDKK